jgi:hypothetical protein
MIKNLHEDAFFRVEHAPDMDVYRVARTNQPFADIKECERAYGAVERALSSVPTGRKLLLDIREAPPRNDPEFEAIVKRVRDRLFGRFARVAVLVRTATGRLQVNRMNQGSPGAAVVFDNEDRAFDHLLG